MRVFVTKGSAIGPLLFPLLLFVAMLVGLSFVGNRESVICAAILCGLMLAFYAVMFAVMYVRTPWLLRACEYDMDVDLAKVDAKMEQRLNRIFHGSAVAPPLAEEPTGGA